MRFNISVRKNEASNFEAARLIARERLTIVVDGVAHVPALLKAKTRKNVFVFTFIR